MTPKDLLKNSPIPAIHSEGYPFISLAALGSILFGLLWVHLFWVGLLVTLFGVFHFRKPKRTPPASGGNLVAPTDGVIEEIEIASLPDDFDNAGKAQMRVRIRGSLADSQVIFAPFSGKVAFAKYKKSPLFADSAGSNEERGETRLFTISGKQDIHISIHAPMLGKKLIEETQSGKRIDLGDELGIGRLVNICDIYLPEKSNVNLLEEQHVIAGETVLASFTEAKKSVGKDNKNDAVSKDNLTPQSNAT